MAKHVAYNLESPVCLSDNVPSDNIARGQLLYSQFEKQCLLKPGNIALIHDGASIQYQELFIQVKQLANYLRQLKVKRNALVAILLPKSAYQVIAALSILKAGAAYMPININESEERKQALLTKGEVDIVLSTSAIIKDSPWLNHYKTVSLDHFFESQMASLQETELESANDLVHSEPSDLAYVLFTSGSTGTPKGVMISHESALNTIEEINERFQITAKDKILALSALDFDLSVYDLFGLLAVGGTVVIPTEKELVEPEQWLALIEKHHITLWDTVPGFMEMLVYCIKLKKDPKKILSSLRLVLLSGDWIRLHLPHEIREYCPYAEIISLGGATEASIWSIAYPIDVAKIEVDWKSIPYGRALKNQAFYILNEHQIPVQGNEEGELYIGGKGVGLGYWRDSTNTEYHFIQHPQFGYLYRTGDKGRYLPDGNIEFLGRIGEQVKLRGFRIDLKAIESCIQSLPEVAHAIAKIIKTSDSADSLIAFVKCTNLASHLAKNDELYQLLIQRHLNFWQTIYNALFTNEKPPENPHFNTMGWVSSYSKGPIADHQMQEWIDTTVLRILSLNPKRVLDVGAGTGLILAKIANHVPVYDAIDASCATIDYLKKYFQEDQNYQHVRLFRGELDQFDLNATYDTVILNSVAQYFPDAVYLVKVLDRLIEKAEQGGHVFLGDIYHYDYLEDFHVSVQLQHQTPSLLLSQFYGIVNQLINNESELFVSPEFFIVYAKQHPRVTQVDIQLKAGLYHNEMNGFRYDVVFSIETPRPERSEPIILDSKSFSTLDAIEKYLSHSEHDSVIVKRLPNIRVIGLSYCANFKSKTKTTVKRLREAVYQHKNTLAIDPYHCYQIGEKLGYKVSCAWSAEKYYFDVAFYKTHNPFAHDCKTMSKQEYDYSHYTNTPLLRQFQKLMEEKIHQHLSDHLAPYMQPHEIVFINELPFTSNGKIDYKALLSRITLIAQEDKYQQPSSPIEEQVQSIFKQVLKLKQVNLSKSFIQLGGDSLMMLEVTHEIEKNLNIKISISDLVSNSSVRELSILLKNRKGLTVEECAIY